MATSNYKQWKQDYFQKKKSIQSNQNLTYLEKENAIRRLANLHELTAEEYKQQEIYYSKQNH